MNKQNGYTLAELVVVLFVLSLLAALAGGLIYLFYRLVC